MKRRDCLEYIATPYWHRDKDLRYNRFRAAARIGGRLLEQGRKVFVPISMTAPVEHEIGVQNLEFWMANDTPFLERCDQLTVAMLPGWDKSKGIALEIKHFREARKPIVFLEVKNWFNDQEWKALETSS